MQGKEWMKAVSPIISTLLLLVIVILLSAFAYIYFTGILPQDRPPIKIIFEQKSTGDGWRLEVISSPQIQGGDIRYILYNANGSIVKEGNFIDIRNNTTSPIIWNDAEPYYVFSEGDNIIILNSIAKPSYVFKLKVGSDIAGSIELEN